MKRPLFLFFFGLAFFISMSTNAYLYGGVPVPVIPTIVDCAGEAFTNQQLPDGPSTLNAYPCRSFSMSTNSRENIYALTILYDQDVTINLSRSGCCVDIFILTDPTDVNSCIEYIIGDNTTITRFLEAGTYYIVVDDTASNNNTYDIEFITAINNCGNIPTLNQWALIWFGLIVLNLGLVFVYRKQLSH